MRYSLRVTSSGIKQFIPHPGWIQVFLFYPLIGWFYFSIILSRMINQANQDPSMRVDFRVFPQRKFMVLHRKGSREKSVM